MTSEAPGSPTQTQNGHDEPRLPKGCADPLDTAYDVALLDLDGVVYLGGTAVPGAAQALRKAHAAGMRLAYVTNNAFRTPAAIAALLTSFGAPATTQDVVTSAQAAARLLAERLPAGAPVLVVGGSGLRMAVRERGLRPVSTAMDRPQAVVQGYCARPQLLPTGRRRPRGRRGRAVRLVQRRSHAAGSAGAPARERLAHPGDRDRDWRTAPGGG